MYEMAAAIDALEFSSIHESVADDDATFHLSCLECGKRFTAEEDEDEVTCPKCGSVDLEMD